MFFYPTSLVYPTMTTGDGLAHRGRWLETPHFSPVFQSEEKKKKGKNQHCLLHRHLPHRRHYSRGGLDCGSLPKRLGLMKSGQNPCHIMDTAMGQSQVLAVFVLGNSVCNLVRAIVSATYTYGVCSLCCYMEGHSW